MRKVVPLFVALMASTAFASPRACYKPDVTWNVLAVSPTGNVIVIRGLTKHEAQEMAERMQDRTPTGTYCKGCEEIIVQGEVVKASIS